MGYFVTGATGFIGRFLVGNLLKRKGTIHMLVRKGSEKKLAAIGKGETEPSNEQIAFASLMRGVHW